MLFGNAQVLLQAGHAFGQNIVTGFGEVPTRDLDPIYIRMAGIEAAFLMDGASYAWDSNGLVVSADLSLSGVTGYTGASAPSSSWVRLPVASTGLNPTPVPDTDVTVKANSIAIPAGFNPRDPASVAAALAALPTNGSDRYAVSQPDDLLLIIPVLESESAEVMTGGFISAIEYEYALTLPAETFELATGGFIEVFAGGVVPAAEVTVAALVPGVSTGASVGVPAAGVAVVGLAPVVAAGISVLVPAAGVAVTALAPVVTFEVSVTLPAAAVAVTALAPVVTSEAGVAEPNIGDAYGGGYFAGYISHTADGVATHRLIVAPAATGATGTGYTLTTMLTVKTTASATTGTGSDFNGAANTAAMVTAGINSHPAAKFCTELTIGGFSDWYLPSRYELDIAYENLKPTTANNSTSWGINNYSVPKRTANRTTSVPARTAVTAFQSGQPQAFRDTVNHWSSTESSTASWRHIFNSGLLATSSKTTSLAVRAFRREAI
jgi:hypothetical protein